MNFNQLVWLGLAVLMLMPILMVFLTLVLPQPTGRWASIIVAAFFFLFNLFAGEREDGTRARVLLPLAPEYIGYADVGELWRSGYDMTPAEFEKYLIDDIAKWARIVKFSGAKAE